ncbi:MAG: PKD domain-containing protein, partial [Bacteroidota bacterium]
SLGTTAPDSTAFIPFYAHQWRRDTLDLAHLRPASSVILRVEFFNRQGNNLYLDDFQVLVDSMAPLASFDWETSGCRPIQLLVRSDATFADSIRWLLPGGLTSAATQVTLNPPPGSVSVTLIAYNHFGTDSITRVISIPYTPIAAFSLSRDTIVRGALLGLLNQSQYGSYYVWNFGDGSPLTAGYAPQKRYNQPGVYPISLWVYGANQCVDSLLQHKEVVVIPPVGIQEFLMRSPTVYPNPGNGLLMVDIRELELPLGLEASIMDLTGRTMNTKQWSAEACLQDLLQWDIYSGIANNQSLPQGYYLLQFQDRQGGRSVQRYLLQH